MHKANSKQRLWWTFNVKFFFLLLWFQMNFDSKSKTNVWNWWNFVVVSCQKNEWTHPLPSDKKCRKLDTVGKLSKKSNNVIACCEKLIAHLQFCAIDEMKHTFFYVSQIDLRLTEFYLIFISICVIVKIVSAFPIMSMYQFCAQGLSKLCDQPKRRLPISRAKILRIIFIVA